MLNRVTQLLGVEHPIIQAPMGYIARAQLASAVSNAGALGIIETSSGRLDEVRDEITKMRDLTDKPFGVNIAQAFVRDPHIVDFVHDQGVRFATTSAGDPGRFTAALHDAGITVFHVVPNLHAAMKAIAAGVDGIVAEGGEGGGFKSTRDVASMVLVPLVCSSVDVPVIAAGGICDGRTMAAAFALGAEGVQMGTRMVSAAESPVHDNYKQLVVESAETGTVFLNRFHKPSFRVLATPYSEAREQSNEQVPMATLDGLFSLYFGGDLDAAFAFGGQVAGRIDEVKPVARDHRRDHGRVPRRPCRRSRPGTRRERALDGLRVLELSEGIAGAYAGKLLRDQGAEVVKLEGAAATRCGSGRRPHPTRPSRAPVRCSRSSTAARRASPRQPGATGPCGGGTSTGPTSWSGERPTRPAPALLHPAVTVVTIEPFGAEGVMADAPASEFTLQAWCGLMSGCGTPQTPPLQMGIRHGQWATGAMAAMAALAGVRHARARASARRSR